MEKKPTIMDVTVEDAYRIYREKGICCVGNHGEVTCEVECEDYCY